MTLRLDMFREPLEGYFRQAPIFRKHVVVTIKKVPIGTEVDVILKDGTHETTQVADKSWRWKVTAPDGEQYLIEGIKVKSRYEHLGGDQYLSKGRVRAFANPYGVEVEIMAPWGSVQRGDGKVIFAAALNDDNTYDGNRYLIGAREFDNTYVPEV